MNEHATETAIDWLADCSVCGAIGPDHCKRPRCEDLRYVDGGELAENVAFNDSPTQTALPAGRVVKVRGRPKDYLAHVERVDYGKIIVRPIAGQGMTTRARSVWRDTITEMEHQQ